MPQQIHVGKAVDVSYYPQFSDLLNQQLAKLDRSPAWLARHLGVNGSTVSRWLNEGARPGNSDVVVRIAEILGMDDQRERLLIAAGFGYQVIGMSVVTDAHTTVAPPLLTSPPVRNNLPMSFTAFIGRVAEIAQLAQQLLNPTCRLLTLAGPGGIGKTRLAIEVTRYLLATEQAFADGAFFVSLIEVNAPHHIDAVIATVLGLTLKSEQEVRDQLQSFLRNKQLLLLLDNFEHLQKGAEEILRLLDDAPQVKVLVTSRAALGVLGEWFYPVDGLEAPEEGAKPEELSRYDSVHLFQQCAQQASPAFDLHSEARHVARICRLVDGMPLAIELAAAWLRLLPCARIAQTFEHTLATLVSPLPNMPPRHRSMHFVLSHSWQMLTAHEAAILEVLAIFQGGFDDAAAIEVAETDLLTLAALAQKSMIRLKQEPATLATGRARYTMHEMLRQFADAQAAQHPAARALALERHSHYYLHWLRDQIPQLVNAGQPDAMALIEEDFDNVRSAWLWATEHEDFALLAAAMDGIYHFCHIRSRALDGAQLLQTCIERLQAQGAHAVDEDPALRHFYGVLLARMGGLHTNVGSTEGVPLLQRSLEYLDVPCERAFVLATLGRAFNWRGDLAPAEALLHESLALSRACDDLLVQGNALFTLCLITMLHGDNLQALAFAQESLAVFRALGRPSSIGHLLAEIGYIELITGDYEAATAHVQQSLPISRRLGYPIGEGRALTFLGFIAWGKGELEEAVAHMQAALVIHRGLGIATQSAVALANLVEVLNDCGLPQQALEYGLESIALARTSQKKELLYSSLRVLGGAQIENGDFAAAHRSLMEALSLAWSSKDLASLLSNLYSQSDLLVRTSRFHSTDESVAACCQALEWLVLLQYHPTCWQVYKDKAARLAAEVAASLPADQVAAAQKRGKALTLDEVIQFLLQQT